VGGPGAAAARLGTLQVVVGGRSSGARVACRTASALGAVAVVALAFPVHPPGRPERTRLPELELPSVPVLVVQGERDPFGMPPAARGRTVHVVPGGDHSLRTGRAALGAVVLDWLATVLS
jgi:predicted alpha/beta-hydrolase family hydrolase